jgi:hypothetical protein
VGWPRRSRQSQRPEFRIAPTEMGHCPHRLVRIMCVTSASAMYTSIYEQVEPEFHANRIQLTAGLSLFVWKLGFEPLIFSPLSEFYGRKHILRVFSGTVHDLARTLRSGQKHCYVARVTFLRRSGRQRLPHRSRWNGGRPFSCGQAKLADDYIHSQPVC